MLLGVPLDLVPWLWLLLVAPSPSLAGVAQTLKLAADDAPESPAVASVYQPLRHDVAPTHNHLIVIITIRTIIGAITTMFTYYHHSYYTPL